VSTPAGRPAPGRLAVCGLVALDEDHHVHSTFSDDAVSTVAENVRAARERGLRVVVLADHVRRGSPWVPDFVAAVRELRPVPDLEVLAGVEAKILNSAGELDLPPSLRGVDRVLIADHQYPGDHGPVPPEDMRDGLERRQCSAADIIDGLIAATLGALERAPAPQLAHLFSLLPKMGLDEADVPGAALDQLAQGCYQAGARVELNEKWACPSPRTIRALAAAGVPLVASTDSHDCATIGRYARVGEILAAVPATPVPLWA
jgi:putative hydrolase